jgi:D-inositol-3-phosphate glycosyltransferase
VNEAMACSLPVVLSSAAGCVPELLRQNWNGFLVQPRDVSSLAWAMRGLADQPDLPATMGANGAQHIAHYSPNEWVEGIERMVEAQAGGRD